MSRITRSKSFFQIMLHTCLFLFLRFWFYFNWSAFAIGATKEIQKGTVRPHEWYSEIFNVAFVYARVFCHCFFVRSRLQLGGCCFASVIFWEVTVLEFCKPPPSNANLEHAVFPALVSQINYRKKLGVPKQSRQQKGTPCEWENSGAMTDHQNVVQKVENMGRNQV